MADLYDNIRSSGANLYDSAKSSAQDLLERSKIKKELTVGLYITAAVAVLLILFQPSFLKASANASDCSLNNAKPLNSTAQCCSKCALSWWKTLLLLAGSFAGITFISYLVLKNRPAISM